MPSTVVAANTVAQQIAAERKNAVHHAKSVTLDNKAGSGNRVIQIQDILTPAVTAGESSPTPDTAVSRWKVTVPQGFIDTYNEEDLKGVRALGAMKVISDVTDASLFITVGYETK